jgi:hypothetical protein
MARIGVCPVGETDEGEQLCDLRTDFICRFAREFQRKGDIVIDCRGGQQVEMLKDHADVAPLLAQLALRHLHEIAPAHEHLAARRTLKHVDAADERGLARTREADDAVDAPALNAQIDPAQRVDVIRICFHNVFQIYHRQAFLWL